MAVLEMVLGLRMADLGCAGCWGCMAEGGNLGWWCERFEFRASERGMYVHMEMGVVALLPLRRRSGV